VGFQKKCIRNCAAAGGLSEARQRRFGYLQIIDDFRTQYTFACWPGCCNRYLGDRYFLLLPQVGGSAGVVLSVFRPPYFLSFLSVRDASHLIYMKFRWNLPHIVCSNLAIWTAVTLLTLNWSATNDTRHVSIIDSRKIGRKDAVHGGFKVFWHWLSIIFSTLNG
jgi:hypothetical protein